MTLSARMWVQDGVTPLLIAAHQGHVAMVRLLLGAGANIQAVASVSEVHEGVSYGMDGLAALLAVFEYVC